MGPIDGQGASRCQQLVCKAGLAAVLSVALLAAGCQSKSKAAGGAAVAPPPSEALAAPTQPAEQTPPVQQQTGEVALTPAPTSGPAEVPSSIPSWKMSQIMFRVTPTGGMRREWSVGVAPRPSGDVVAWPLYYQDVGNRKKWPDWQAPFIEPALFLADTGLLPVNMVLTPPWRKVVYSEASDQAWTPNPPADVESTGAEK
jgi:hypothetical protein